MLTIIETKTRSRSGPSKMYMLTSMSVGSDGGKAKAKE